MINDTSDNHRNSQSLTVLYSYNSFQTYVMPLIFNLKKKEEKLDKLETAIAQTNASVTEAVGSVQTTLESVQVYFLNS